MRLKPFPLFCSKHNLSFSFAFFVHGDSTVCASIDLREHPAVRRLTMDHVNEAIQQAAAAASNQQSAPPAPPPPPFPHHQQPQASKAQTPLASPATGGPSSNNNNNGSDSVPKPQRVILAPFGMSGTLTGQVYRQSSLDAATQKALDDWCAFYPLSLTSDHRPDEMPVMVEVVTGGVKLRYPSKYVLVSDIDELDAEDEDPTAAEEDVSRAAPSIKSEVEKAVDGGRNGSIMNNSKEMDLRQKNGLKSGAVFTAEPLGGNDLGHPLSMHLRPTVATVLPERVWQDCMLNPLSGAAGGGQQQREDKSGVDKTVLPMVSPSQIKQEPMETMSSGVRGTESNSSSSSSPSSGGQQANNGMLKFVDPSQKSSCCCTK